MVKNNFVRIHETVEYSAQRTLSKSFKNCIVDPRFFTCSTQTFTAFTGLSAHKKDAV